MNTKVIDGNEACSIIAYMFSEVVGIYPITPASNMSENIDKWSFQNKKNLFGFPVKLTQMQSEAGAIAVVHGALQTGVLSNTFTSSQGLLLMIPNMYKIAGQCFPCVIHVSARSIATHALSILGDHQDIYVARSTGFTFLASSSVQDVAAMSLVAHLSTITGKLPVLNFFDGFRTSHEINKIIMPSTRDVEKLLDYKSLDEFRKNSLLSKKLIRGTAQNDDVFFQNLESRNPLYNNFPDIVNDYMQKANKLMSTSYKPFNYYGAKNAKKVIVAMGSVCSTIKEVIDNEAKKGNKLGLIEVHLYRPFSSKYFFNVLPKTVKSIAVLDRTKEPGSTGEPLYLDVVSLFSDVKNSPNIIGGRYGISSKNTGPASVKAVYDFLDNKNNFTGFTVGINDDVTNLSIKIPNYKIEDNETTEMLIYGYGSDGMTGAAKDIIKIIGSNLDLYTQGYFQYDSRKSGNVTKSHIRLSKNEINKTYYIDRPNIIVCTKDSYINEFDILTNIKESGKIILATSLSDEKINEMLPKETKEDLVKKNVSLYKIDAYKLAKENNLTNKISIAMERLIFEVLDISNKEDLISKIKESVVSKFENKGNEVVMSNINILNDSPAYLKRVLIDKNIKATYKEKQTIYNDKVFNMTINDKGNELSVSDFSSSQDGSFMPGTTKYEKRNVSDFYPKWDKEKCVQCNQCSFVCPHAVIRPFILNDKEVNKYNLLKEVLPAIKSDFKYYLAVSQEDCTGCGLCADTCPTKALEMVRKEDESNINTQHMFDNVLNKNEYNKWTIKGSQFEKPLFEFSGACAGCGQTPYLKLLTQLFGERLVIANATGCSSIYGASHPSMPYSVSWANSLFEDNAEFGLGMKISYDLTRVKINCIINQEYNKQNSKNKDLLKLWIDNKEDYNITKKVMEELDYKMIKELEPLKEYIPSKVFWIVGGDGWAYDIGYGGIDHVLSSKENVNILVLDTECYSNTGGQASKATKTGAVAKFAIGGKELEKKDLARAAMNYKGVYVANISLGANMNQAVKAFKEAKEHDGPSLIIAYSPCINHGIKSGMVSTIREEKLVVESGYFPLFRYNPETKKLSLDYKTPDFSKYNQMLDNEQRYTKLKIINSKESRRLLDKNKEQAIERFKYYEELSKK